MSEYLIKHKDFTNQEILALVDLHKQEIGQGFLSSLGNKALELVFNHLSVSKHGFLKAVYSDNHKPIGFINGSFNTSKFYKDFIIKKTVKAVFYLFPKLFSLEKLKKIFETLLYPSKSELVNLPEAELLDFAVDNNFHGKGIAKILFDEFVEEMKNNNTKSFKITTGESLIPAQKFYEKQGAKKVGEIEIHKGQKTFIYEYIIG